MNTELLSVIERTYEIFLANFQTTSMDGAENGPQRSATFVTPCIFPLQGSPIITTGYVAHRLYIGKVGYCAICGILF